MGGFRRLARAAFGAALAGGRRVGTRSVSRTWTVDPAYVATRSRRESTLPMGARFASSSSSNDEPSTSGSGSVEVHGWGSTGEDVTDPDGSTRRDLEIAIDRTGLFRQIDDAHGGSNPATKNLVGLEKHFASIINFRGGPITVAEYMQEVLTHPEFGYYMHRDVFGEKGDFITSPEVSQVFGELMGAWAVWQWKTMGSPKECHLIELGPGRGTLMADLLRGTSVFPEFTAAVTVHLVEVSPKNRATQREKLRCSSGRDGASSCSDDARSEGAKKSIKRVRVPKNPMAGVVAGDSTENSTSHSTATDGVPAPGGKSPPYQPGAHGSTPEELGLEAVDFGFSEFCNVRYGTFPPAALRRPDITSNAGDCCPYIATYSSCVLDGLRPERRIPGGLYHDCLRTTNPGYTRVIPTDTFGFYNQGGVARNPGRGSGWAEYRVGARVLRRHACSSVHQNRTGVVRKAGGDPGERGAWG
jgi:hypothetical protein